MHVLERSYPQPVHLRLEVDCGNGFDRWCRLISATLPQLEYLELTISAFYHSTAREPLQLHVAAMWQYLGRFLASPAPMLHTLYLTVHRDLDAEPFYLRDDILGGLPGRLRSCSLFDIRLPHSGSCTALSSVTTFDYSVCGAVIDERVIRRIFTMMPNLETFGLAAAIDAPLSPSPSYHSNLKRASIVVPRSADTSNLRGLFQHFHSVTLDITCVGSPSLDAGLEGYVDWQAPTCLFFTASFTVVAQLGADGHSAVRLARNYAWPPLSTSHSLVSLVVHEQVISYIGSPPTAPQISELCVVLASACEHEAPWFSSIFSDTGPLFDFSSLQVLRLCYLDARLMCNTHVCQYPDLDASRSLALSDVAEFIAGRVRFGSPRLARLVLEGVRNLVDVDLARAMSGLWDVVEEVDFATRAADDILRVMTPHNSRRSEDPTSVFDATDLPDETWARL